MFACDVEYPNCANKYIKNLKAAGHLLKYRKKCHKGIREVNDQLYIDQYILMEEKCRIGIDKKTCDMSP